MADASIDPEFANNELVPDINEPTFFKLYRDVGIPPVHLTTQSALKACVSHLHFRIKLMRQKYNEVEIDFKKPFSCLHRIKRALSSEKTQIKAIETDLVERCKYLQKIPVHIISDSTDLCVVRYVAKGLEGKDIFITRGSTKQHWDRGVRLAFSLFFDGQLDKKLHAFPFDLLFALKVGEDGRVTIRQVEFDKEKFKYCEMIKVCQQKKIKRPNGGKNERAGHTSEECQVQGAGFIRLFGKVGIANHVGRRRYILKAITCYLNCRISLMRDKYVALMDYKKIRGTDMILRNMMTDLAEEEAEIQRIERDLLRRCGNFNTTRFHCIADMNDLLLFSYIARATRYDGTSRGKKIFVTRAGLKDYAEVKLAFSLYFADQLAEYLHSFPSEELFELTVSGDRVEIQLAGEPARTSSGFQKWRIDSQKGLESKDEDKDKGSGSKTRSRSLEGDADDDEERSRNMEGPCDDPYEGSSEGFTYTRSKGYTDTHLSEESEGSTDSVVGDVEGRAEEASPDFDKGSAPHHLIYDGGSALIIDEGSASHHLIIDEGSAPHHLIFLSSDSDFDSDVSYAEVVAGDNVNALTDFDDGPAARHLIFLYSESDDDVVPKNAENAEQPDFDEGRPPGHIIYISSGSESSDAGDAPVVAYEEEDPDFDEGAPPNHLIYISSDSDG